MTTSRLQGGVINDRANIGINFAIGRKGISPVNLSQIMHTPGGKARGHGGSGKIFMGGREE